MKEHELHNYKLVLQYEGIRYNGWQKQKNQENTIQEVKLDLRSGNIHNYDS